jgi:hypothetical protein
MDIEGEEIQTKGIDNLFNKVIAENFPNLDKERNIQISHACGLVESTL